MVSLFPQPCPQLPDFHTLLVRGCFHASAPIHLLLSHTADDPEARAILLTPRRNVFKDALIELNDKWISQHSGMGKHCSAAQRIEVFYPPTLAHLLLLLSMLHGYDDTLHHAKTTLDTAPTLLVIHEISTYFTDQASEATVSAYLSVISSALALSAAWSPQCQTTSRLVLFDSGLGALKLPILRSLSFDGVDNAEARRRDTLSVLLERYFEWQAEFPEGADGGSDDGMRVEDHAAFRAPGVKSLRLRHLQLEMERRPRVEGGEPDSDEYTGIVWNWTESNEMEFDGVERTVFQKVVVLSA